MKIYSLLLLFFFAETGITSAQISISKDTSFTDVCRGNIVKPVITFSNSTDSLQTFSWNVDPLQSVIPSGYTVTGICFLPGLCYVFNSAIHTEVLDSMKSGIIEPEINVSNLASLDSSAIITINLDINGINKKVVFKVMAIPCAPTALNNINSIAVKMYPLPAQNILNVVHNNIKVAKAFVYNIYGNKIMEYNTATNANDFSINTSMLPNGIYILQIQDANHINIATQRFSKN